LASQFTPPRRPAASAGMNAIARVAGEQDEMLPSAPGGFSGGDYAACFLGAAERALARWIRFSLAARPRRTWGFIPGTTGPDAFTCSRSRHRDQSATR
jgi:hypothetical protein